MQPATATRKRQVTVFDLNYTVADHGRYFVVAVHRTTPGQVVRFYYRPSRASLLRVNRAQRLLIRRMVNGYVAPAAPPDESDTRFQLLVAAASVEPASNAELRQAVSE